MILVGQPKVVLAPMEGVTDAPMRAFQSELGGVGLTVSEFIRVSQSALPSRVFYDHVPELLNGARTPSGVAVMVQLLGGDPERLAESAQVACRAGAPGIDLNFGCPAPTVNRHDGGATLLKYPDRIYAIVRAVRQAVPAELPVSAKLRLGWDQIDAIHHNVDRAVEGGAAWVTIHARTRMAGYAPPVYWEPIGIVRKRLESARIPVVANGDIWSIDDFRRCREMTGCEHFMLGRGLLANPRLGIEVSRELGIGTHRLTDSVLEGAHGALDWLTFVRRFSEVSEPYSRGGGYTAGRIKQWLKQASRRGTFSGFDQIKGYQHHDEIVRAIGARQEARESLDFGAALAAR